MKTAWRGRVFRYAPILLWTGVILYLSTSQASMSETSLFVRPLLEFLFPDASEQTLVIYHSYIRKLAHFVEYAILAFFASRAFWSSRVGFLNRYWHLFALVLVLTVAAIDEINQSFELTRTGSLYDVLLDGLGGLVTVTLLVVHKRYRNN